MVTVAEGFSRLAPWYDVLASICSCGWLFRSQVKPLVWLPPSIQHVLLIGAGTGRIIEPLLSSFPHIQITCVELSPGMYMRLQKRYRSLSVEHQKQVQCIQDDIRTVSLTGTFDVCITPYVLDVFDQETVAQVIAKVSSCLSECAYWLDIDFYIPPAGGVLQRWLVSCLYIFFGLTCSIQARRLPELESVWIQHGFHASRSTAYCFSFLQARMLKRILQKEGNNGNTEEVHLLGDK